MGTIFGQNFLVDKFNDLDNIRNLIEFNSNFLIKIFIDTTASFSFPDYQLGLLSILILLLKWHVEIHLREFFTDD